MRPPGRPKGEIPSRRDGAQRQGSTISLLARAVALLARRDHSRAELARKLKRYLGDEDPANIDGVLDELERRKLLSDARFAGAVARTKAGKFGDARIRHDLRTAGVEDEAAAAALTSLGTEVERARAVWRKRFGVIPTSAAERGRQARFLQSRGFNPETIHRVLRGAGDVD
jgi:regulatory protein